MGWVGTQTQSLGQPQLKFGIGVWTKDTASLKFGVFWGKPYCQVLGCCLCPHCHNLLSGNVVILTIASKDKEVCLPSKKFVCHLEMADIMLR